MSVGEGTQGLGRQGLVNGDGNPGAVKGGLGGRGQTAQERFFLALLSV